MHGTILFNCITKVSVLNQKQRTFLFVFVNTVFIWNKPVYPFFLILSHIKGVFGFMAENTVERFTVVLKNQAEQQEVTQNLKFTHLELG